ncbi:MAG: SRPBCC family protein [Candidatus Sericytochromatia bacterium]|uniref:SRPBCC family protein n=1 Tax=Candidatus Tanganyikabacteria bacterium TaxID=2961651 RepID=A0A937X784_9BACT|nr:SRPBCC family protein [Candidatus Tanganyikabacteria bacterium]
MNRLLPALLAALPLLAVGPAAAKAKTQLTSFELKKVNSGKIVTAVEETTQAVKTVTSVGVVNRPARDVFLLMADFKNYARIYNSIEKADVEPGGSSVVIAHYLVRAPWPLEPRTVTTRTWLAPDRHEFRWERVKGTLKEYEGGLVAVPASGGKCIVYYSAKVDLGYDWLPSWFVTWGQTYVLPSIIHAIRDTLTKREGPYWANGVERPAFSIEP